MTIDERVARMAKRNTMIEVHKEWVAKEFKEAVAEAVAANDAMWKVHYDRAAKESDRQGQEANQRHATEMAEAVKNAIKRECQGWRNSTAYAKTCEENKREAAEVDKRWQERLANVEGEWQGRLREWEKAAKAGVAAAYEQAAKMAEQKSLYALEHGLPTSAILFQELRDAIRQLRAKPQEPKSTVNVPWDVTVYECGCEGTESRCPMHGDGPREAKPREAKLRPFVFFVGQVGS